MTKRIPDWRALGRIEERVMLSSAGASTTTAGALAATAWLRKRGQTPPWDRRWHIELGLKAERETSAFRLEIANDEWGYHFVYGAQSSWIRIKSLPFVHERDDLRLLSRTPPLREISTFVRFLEQEHGVSFSRRHVSISTDLPGIEREARAWIATL